MAIPPKPGWSKPSTILFASEIPANEKAFAFALAQAVEFGADLIIFHAYDSLGVAAWADPAIECDEYSAARAVKIRLEPIAQRARNLGIQCRIVVRLGWAVGKLLVGSVAEAVLRTANVPVCIVGPNVVEGTYRNFVTRKILCDVSKQEGSRVVAHFGAEMACRHNASLILHRVIPPQERAEALGDRTIDQIEAELPSLVPVKFKHKIRVRTKVALGDPTEELLYQGRAQQANLIVLGAQGASHFAAISRAGTVYKVLAYAQCPVITMSPIVLAQCGATEEKPRTSQVNYLAGVF